MSYRVVKKCTKNTEGRCKECKFYKELSDVSGLCEAPDKVIKDAFNPKHFYCELYKGFSDMSKTEVDKLIERKHKKDALSEYKLYIKKYYTKEEGKQLIKEFKDGNK